MMVCIDGLYWRPEMLQIATERNLSIGAKCYTSVDFSDVREFHGYLKDVHNIKANEFINIVKHVVGLTNF